MSIPDNTPFFSSLQDIFSQLSKTTFREKAWNHFLQLGLPTKAWDSFKYLSLKRLYDLKLSLALSPISQEIIEAQLIPEARDSYLVMAHGRFVKELSKIPPQMVVLPFTEALKTYGSFLHGRLTKTLKEENDPFALLNLALEQDGVFCYLPPHLKLASPLQIIYYGTGDTAYHPARFHLFCSTGSEIKTVATVLGAGVHHVSMDVVLEEKSHLSHMEKSTARFLLNDFRATLKAAATLQHLALTSTGDLNRHRLRIALIGEHAEALLQGLWTLSSNHQCHTHVYVEHIAPSCRSLQKYKGVLQDTAQSSFEGKIYVHPEAQKTEAYQLNRNLLLSPGVIANAKPNLEIFADDVKASHGATMTELDPEELFYVQSRGVSQETARRLLIDGFMQEILSQVPYERWEL